MKFFVVFSLVQFLGLTAAFGSEQFSSIEVDSRAHCASGFTLTDGTSVDFLGGPITVTPLQGDSSLWVGGVDSNRTPLLKNLDGSFAIFEKRSEVPFKIEMSFGPFAILRQGSGYISDFIPFLAKKVRRYTVVTNAEATIVVADLRIENFFPLDFDRILPRKTSSSQRQRQKQNSVTVLPYPLALSFAVDSASEDDPVILIYYNDGRVVQKALTRDVPAGDVSPQQRFKGLNLPYALMKNSGLVLDDGRIVYLWSRMIQDVAKSKNGSDSYEIVAILFESDGSFSGKKILRFDNCNGLKDWVRLDIARDNSVEIQVEELVVDSSKRFRVNKILRRSILF